MRMKKFLAVALALAMAAALVPGLAVTAGAEANEQISPDVGNSISVISGNMPVLPADVEWDISDNDFISDTEKTITVTGTRSDGTEEKVLVTVYPVSFALPDSRANTIINFPVDISDEFKIEFDFLSDSIQNNWIYISDDGALWGGGQIGMGTDDNTTGAFNFKSGSGQTESTGITLKSGTTYRFFVIGNAATDKYTASVTDSSTGKIVAHVDNQTFRTASEKINSINITNNGTTDKFTVSNIKINAPSVDSQFTKYTVHFDGVDRPDESFPELASKVDNLPANAYIPSYKIPYIKGYVFKDYALSGTTYTLTYAKSADSLGTWFTRNNLSSPTVSLNLMNFLGAHDAFTKKIESSSVGDAAGAKTKDSGSQMAVMAGASVRDSSKTQDEAVYGLLNAGVRYFDIRLSVSDLTEPNTPVIIGSRSAQGTNGEYYTTHALLAQPFKTVLYTIRDFCNENPGEVIVLDFQTLYNALDAYGEGKSSSNNWDDVYKLLVETGVSKFLVSGNTSPSGHTWTSMTGNGAHAAVVCFGQAGSQNTQKDHFISASSRRAGYSTYDGYLYSYFENSSPTSYNYLINDIKDNQVANIGDRVWPFRVMQAIFGNLSSAPITNARTTTANLIQEADFKSWIKALPVVMMDDAAVNTSEYLKLFATFNRDGDDETYTNTVESVKVEGPTASVPFSTKLTAEKTGKNYQFKLTQFADADVNLEGAVTLTFPDATGKISGLKTVVYCDGKEVGSANSGSNVTVSNVTDLSKPFTVTTEAADAKPDAKLGYNGTDLTLDFTFDGITSAIEADSFKVTVTNQNGDEVGTASVTKAEPNVLLTPKDSNAIYTAVIEVVKGGTNYSAGTIKASLYSEVVENLEAMKETYGSGVNAEMIAKVNAVITHGGVYYDSDKDTLNDETKKIVTVTEADGKITVKVNEPYNGYGIGFILSGNKVCIGSTDREVTDAVEGKVYDSFTIDGNSVTLANAEEAVTLSLDAVDIEFVETPADEIEADGVDAQIGLVPEI